MPEETKETLEQVKNGTILNNIETIIAWLKVTGAPEHLIQTEVVLYGAFAEEYAAKQKQMKLPEIEEPEKPDGEKPNGI